MSRIRLAHARAAIPAPAASAVPIGAPVIAAEDTTRWS